MTNPHSYQSRQCSHVVRFFAFSAIILLGIVTACKNENTDAKLKYAMTNEGMADYDSILKSIDYSKGKLRACIYHMDDAPSQILRDSVRMKLEIVANSWVESLQGENGWSVNQVSITATHLNQFEECDTRKHDLQVRVYSNAEKWKNSLPNQNLTWAKGFAYPSERRIDLGPGFLALEDSLQLGSIMHEFGHLIGLGDTYKFPDDHAPVGTPKVPIEGHPKSLMGGSVEANGKLQPDDKAGAKAMWRYVNTGVFACDTEYETRKDFATGRVITYCFPKTSSTDKPAKPVFKPE